MPKSKPPVLKGSDGKPFVITINEFKAGTQTLLDDSRIPQTGVKTSQNMMLDQDGVWRIRDGSQAYGKTLTGPIDGSGTIVKYNSDGTTTSWLLVIDNGTLKRSADGGAWTSISGKTYTTGYPAQLLQVKSRVYITNGKDALSYYDIALDSIVTYIALAVPATVTSVKTGLAGTNYTAYYKVTAVLAAIGETAASAETSVTIGKQRTVNGTTPNWTSGTDFVTIGWGAVASADRYNIYYSDQTGQEIFLDSVTGTSYIDTGYILPNPYQAAPAFDGTAGPALGTQELSGNRLWGTGDNSNPYRVSWTGTGSYFGSFNPYYGGGYIDLELGGAERPQSVKHYRDGKGNQVPAVLTNNPTGGGSVWFITLTTVSAGALLVVIPQATKQGSIGTNSPRGVISANNNVYYPSVKGFQSLGSSQAIFNVLVTSEMSANIRPNVRALTGSATSGICGIYYLGRIYWSVPYGSSANNQIWVLDLERQTWCIAWSIGVKQFIEYADSTGMVHLLGVPITGTQLIEFSSSIQGDSGLAFPTQLESGLITWDKDHTEWARVDKVYVELLRPKGNISFQISGTQKGKSLSLIQSISITDTVSSSGMGADLMGDFLMGDSNSSPSTYSQASVKKRLRIHKKLNNLKWTIISNDVNASYSLGEIVIKGKVVQTSDPSSWK